MTLIKNSSVFQPINKFIKISDNRFIVNNGANVLSFLDMCDVKLNYEQYLRTQIIIPAGQTDFIVSFPAMGIKTTFLVIKPLYSVNSTNNNFIKLNFTPNTGPKLSMTKLMVLTGTVSNPIPSITVDNPNTDYPVALDILLATTVQDYINDESAFLYLNGLTFDKVHTFEETNSGILAFFDKDNILAGTVNISDVANVYNVPGKNRIIIDDNTLNNIILDFISINDTKQALSAINLLLLDSANRALPQTADTTPPVLTYTSRVQTETITIDLSLFDDVYTKEQFITDAILSCVDNRDGSIIISPTNIVFKKGNLVFNTLNVADTYTATITISDIAGNITIEDITVEAQAVIVDTTPPLITFTSAVTGNVIDPIDILLYGGIVSYNDIRVLCITSVIDDIDGNIPLSQVGVLFFDLNLVPINGPIITEGNYIVRLTVSDSHNNIYTNDFTLLINNANVNKAPEIKFNSNNVNSLLMSSNIDLLVDYGSGVGLFTKDDAINYMIDYVIDDNDGNIVLTTTNVTFINSLNQSVNTISSIGTFTVRFTVTDNDSLTTIKNITLTVI